MRTYTAIAERSGDWWAVSVPEVRGVFTQAKRLEQVAPMAREAIALLLDAPEDQVDVSVEVKLPKDLSEIRENVIELRADIDEKRARYRQQLSDAVVLLTKGFELSLRDAAAILEVSYQRVSQVAEGATAGDRPTRARNTTPEKVAKVAPAKVAKATARKAVPYQPATARRKAAAAARKAAAAARATAAARKAATRGRAAGR